MPRRKPEASAEPLALRVWKRDKSRNYMALEAAVANLKQNGHQKEDSEIPAALFRGETLETPHAEFRIVGAA